MSDVAEGCDIEGYIPLSGLPPVVKQFIIQLCSESFLRRLEQVGPGEQFDVILKASGGRAVKRPVIMEY